MWSITKNVANSIDSIETKIDAIEHEINILLINNEATYSKLDTIVHKTDTTITDTNTNFISTFELDHESLNPDNPIYKDSTYNTASNQSTIITSPQTTLQLHCFNAGHGTTIININGMNIPTHQGTSHQVISNRPKYLALSKIIGGITLATTSLVYGTIGGSIATTLGFLDHEFGLLMVGPILVVASLPLEYCGYKLVKSGMQDLKEFAKFRKKALRLGQISK